MSGPADELPMEPAKIFELIISADEKLKYANDANREVRERQARELLDRAIEAARAIGNDALVAQANQRLADLASEGAGSPAQKPQDPEQT